MVGDVKHVDKVETVSGLDFTKYKAKNFLITPGVCGEDHEALGIYTFSVYPEMNFKKYPQTQPVMWGAQGEYDIVGWVPEPLSPEEILDFVYNTAIAKGADAITHFRIKKVHTSFHDGMEMIPVTGFEVEGLLIKRK